MPGIFKKLNASDIKITPFEAHKQYNTVDLPSIGATTSSLVWSGGNKSEFSTGSRKYYQLDKLYYRNYIQERAHRLELDDATYTTQERRLYASASVLSLSQKTFGSEVQPGTFELSGSNGNLQYNLKDDGFGNLYDTNLGKDNFPNEDNRVLYIAPVQAFKRKDLNIDITTGNPLVNIDMTGSIPVYNKVTYDDSYFQNIITYNNVSFSPVGTPSGTATTLGGNFQINHPAYAASDGLEDASYITIKNQPHLNFNNEDFAISCYFNFPQPTTYEQLWTNDSSNRPSSSLHGDFLLSKEGAQISPPLGTQAGGYNSMNASGALDMTTTPANPAFPYRVRCFSPSQNSASIELSRFDGDTLSAVSAVIFTSGSDRGTDCHILLQKTGSNLEIYKNGIKLADATDETSKACQNNADVVIYSRRNPDGTYHNSSTTWDHVFNTTQFMIYNQSLSSAEIINVSQSVTGTPNIGNIFYDNGFAVITHPKYMGVFEGGSLNTLKYKNTHLITENEFQCTMNENEFEFTRNITARKNRSDKSEDIAAFATGSNFKPYITTIGLYDENANLLLVGKLAQPVRASSETDTTFVIRYDT
tara:strand:- start:794 stop:2557 length:1764 start_codon:yes stop_codon:yes gene_type:complete